MTSLEIKKLQPSQLYLSGEKVQALRTSFSLAQMDPLIVREVEERF